MIEDVIAIKRVCYALLLLLLFYLYVCVDLVHVSMYINQMYITFNRGSTVVKMLCYKSEGRRFDPSWCQWIDIKSFRSHYGPGVDSASNRNEYEEYFLGVKAAGA